MVKRGVPLKTRSIQSTMSSVMQRYAVQCAQLAYRPNRTRQELADAVKARFEEKFGMGWQVVVGEDFGFNVCYRKRHSITMQLEDPSPYKVLLFMSAPSAAANDGLLEEDDEVDEGSQRRSHKVHFCAMARETQSSVVELIRRAYASAADEVHQGTRIKAALNTMHKGVWHVVVSHKPVAVAASYDDGSYLHMAVGSTQYMVATCDAKRLVNILIICPFVEAAECRAADGRDGPRHPLPLGGITMRQPA